MSSYLRGDIVLLKNKNLESLKKNDYFKEILG